MALRRTLHKKISVCEQLADVSDLAKLAYTWGILHADDWGALKASPRGFKAEVLPLHPASVDDVAAAIDELVAVRLVVRYTADAVPYLWFPTFDAYQEGLHKRTSRNRLPLPDEADSGSIENAELVAPPFPEVPGNGGDNSRNFPETPASRARGSETKGKEERLRLPSTPPTPPPGEQQAEPDHSLLQPDGRPHDAGTVLCEAMVLRDGVKHATSDRTWSQAQRDALVIELHQAVIDPATPVDEKTALDWLATTPPVLTDRKFPDRYLIRMMRESRGAAAPQGGPRNKEPFAILCDGTRVPESEWTFGQDYLIQEQIAAGNWNASTGRTKTPVKNLACDDGRAYPAGGPVEGVPLA